jgi:hypothetical protein
VISALGDAAGEGEEVPMEDGEKKKKKEKVGGVGRSGCLCGSERPSTKQACTLASWR